MRTYLVEYGADGWRNWVTVPADSPDNAETWARGAFPKATWSVVVDDVTGLVVDDIADTVEGHAKGLY